MDVEAGIKYHNILTLKERVRAIHEYDRMPVYRRVAAIMNCSSPQIMRIIQNRESILLQYASKTGDCQDGDDGEMHKIELLNEIMFEWVLRMQCRGNSSQITANLVQAIALDVKRNINIPNFRSNSKWFKSFLRQYQLTEEGLMNERVYADSTRPKEHLSLEVSKIVKYVKGLRDNSKESNLQSGADTAEHRNHNKLDCGYQQIYSLPLHAKVAVIKLYDKYPVYGKVARHFPCSTGYIKTIVDSRDEILKEWNERIVEMPITEKKIQIADTVGISKYRPVMKREMQVLNNEMGGWMRGCMFEPNFVAPDSKTIKAKARAMKKLYKLPTVVIDKDWITSFRWKYNLIGRGPVSSSSEEENSLTAECDVMPQVSKAKEITNITKKQKPIQLNSHPYKRPWPRTRQLALLNDTMFKWLLRKQSSGKGHQLSPDFIIQTARKANEHFKIFYLTPDKRWFNKFLLKYDLKEEDLMSQRVSERCTHLNDSLSLKVPDIVDVVKQKKKGMTSKRQTFTHRFQIAFSKSKCGEVVDVVPVDEGACNPHRGQEVGEIVDDVVSVTNEEAVDDADHQPDAAKRYKITYCKLRCGTVVPGSVPKKGSYTRRKNMEVDEVVEIVDDVIPAEDACTPRKDQEVVEIVDDVVPAEGGCTPRKDQEVVEIVDKDDEAACTSLPGDEVLEGIEPVDGDVPGTVHKDVSYNRRKNMEVVEIVDDVVPVEDACIPRKDQEVVEIIDDDDEAACTSMPGDEVVEGIEPVDGDVAYIMEDVCPKEEYDEDEHVPRKVSRFEGHDSRDTEGNIKHLIRSDEDEDVLQYWRTLCCLRRTSEQSK